MQNIDVYVNNTNKSSNTISKRSKLNIILLSSIIAGLNVLFSTNYAISMMIIVFELIILIYYFIKKDITRYVGSYLLFLCLSFEFDLLVGTELFYGFKNFRIFGVNLGIIALLPIVALTILKKIKVNKIKREFPRLYKFAIIIIFMNITGLILGLFQILINDNNIQDMDEMLGEFIGVSYTMIAIPFLIIIAIAYLISWEKDKLEYLPNYLTAILVGIVSSMIVSLLSGRFGQYGGVNTLLVTNVIRYVPFLLLFPFYSERKSQKLLGLVAIIGAILSLMYNASGKMLILYGLVPFGVITIYWRRRKILPLMFIFLLLPIVVFLSIQMIDDLASNSILFSVKLREASSILKFWDSNWLINMPLSPRTRIIEFLSIFQEYLEKPWFFIFGKGYMGTITDHTGMLGEAFITNAYSINQWINGSFYGVHETLNILFLYHGLFGLIFYLYMIKFVFANFSKSPWILVGGFWFLMIYGFSVTMTAFGITALLIGQIEIDKMEIVSI